MGQIIRHNSRGTDLLTDNIVLPYFLAILPFPAVLQWGISCSFAKDFSKITGVSQTTVRRNFCYWSLAVCKHLAGCLYTIAFYVLHRRHMQILLKNPVTFSFAYEGILGEFGYKYFFRVMLMDVYHHPFHFICSTIHRLRFFLDCGHTYLQQPQPYL